MSKVHTVSASSKIGMDVVISPELTRTDLESDNPTGKVIFEGNVVSRKDAADTMTERTASVQSVNYYDLFDHIDELISHPMMKARVLSSSAWMLDNMVINQARSVFYDTYKESNETGSIDGFSDFISKMSELKAGESYAEDLGFELGSGRISQIGCMLSLSEDWHAAAEATASNARVKYTRKSFEDLIKSETVQKIDSLTTEKLGALVEAQYEDEDDVEENEVEEAKALLMNQQIIRNRETHAARQKIGPAVLRIIDYVGTKVANEAREFWQLPVDSQARLIAACEKSIQRALTDLATYKSIPTLEYISLIREAKQARKKLNAVLATGKFANRE